MNVLLEDPPTVHVQLVLEGTRPNHRVAADGYYNAFVVFEGALEQGASAAAEFYRHMLTVSGHRPNDGIRRLTRTLSVGSISGSSSSLPRADSTVSCWKDS